MVDQSTLLPLTVRGQSAHGGSMCKHALYRFTFGCKFAWYVFSIVLILNCGEVEARRESSVPDTLDPSAGAVLPVGSGPELANACTRRGPRNVIGYFTPDKAQIDRLEMRLPAAVEQERSRTAKPPVSNYHRQYIGIVRAGDRKSILVNAFPREHLDALNRLLPRLPKDGGSVADTVPWRQLPIAVCDGGPAFWSVEFDLTTGSFRSFQYNQPAS